MLSYSFYKKLNFKKRDDSEIYLVLLNYIVTIISMFDVEKYNVALSEKDVQILESMKVVIAGLADYLGEGYEFVLHSLENIEKSVIMIINGHHTGRKIGAPITDKALEMLDKIKAGDDLNFVSYYTRNKTGAPLKSSTIAVRGEHNRIIGLLCINFYLNTPYIDIIESFSEERRSYQQENFLDNSTSIVLEAIGKARKSVYENNNILVSQKNKEIISILNQQSIFKMKDAVAEVAKELGLSKNTVYMHLHRLNGKD